MSTSKSNNVAALTRLATAPPQNREILAAGNEERLHLMGFTESWIHRIGVKVKARAFMVHVSVACASPEMRGMFWGTILSH